MYIQIYRHTTIYICIFVTTTAPTTMMKRMMMEMVEWWWWSCKHFWKNPIFQIAVPCFCSLAFCSCQEDTAAVKCMTCSIPKLTIVLKLCRVSWRLKHWGWCFPLLWLRSTLVSATAVCPWTSWQEAFRGLEFMWMFYARDSGDYGPSSGPTCCFCSFNPSQPGSKLPWSSNCVELWIWSL